VGRSAISGAGVRHGRRKKKSWHRRSGGKIPAQSNGTIANRGALGTVYLVDQREGSGGSEKSHHKGGSASEREKPFYLPEGLSQGKWEQGSRQGDNSEKNGRASTLSPINEKEKKSLARTRGKGDYFCRGTPH